MDERHFPWTTGPSGEGATRCASCDRDIYRPALPCSVAPIEGLDRMATLPGFGRRCQYELATRRPAPAAPDADARPIAIEPGTQADIG